MSVIYNLHEIGKMTRSDFENACIAHRDHLYMGSGNVLCKVLTKHKMMVDAKDLGIAPHLIMDGYWESWLTQLFAQIVQPGNVCIDIGANFGYFSILLAELAGNDGRAIAVEANPHIADFLRSTRFLNGGRFDVLNVAMSDKKGEAVLTVTDRELGGGTIKPNELLPGKTQVKVPTISVDELVREHGLNRVDVIKIDVEGMEPTVFKGMRETISNNPQLKIILEYSPSIYEDAADFTEYLFSNFTVNRVKDVDTVTKLDRSAIPALVSMTDHTDLYLTKLR